MPAKMHHQCDHWLHQLTQARSSAAETKQEIFAWLLIRVHPNPLVLRYRSTRVLRWARSKLVIIAVSPITPERLLCITHAFDVKKGLIRWSLIFVQIVYEKLTPVRLFLFVAK